MLESLARNGALLMVDADIVSSYLSALTQGKFSKGDVRSYPVQKERVKWFLWSTYDRRVPEVPYIHIAWMEVDGTLHIETKPLGDTSDTTEWMYGDKALHEFVDMDLTGFDREEVRAEYAKKFPLVVKRLETYIRLTAKESARTGVRMQFLLNGSKGLASFHLQANFGTKKLDEPHVRDEIDRSVAALRKVYYEIAQRQEHLYFIYALPSSRKGAPQEGN